MVTFQSICEYCSILEVGTLDKYQQQEKDPGESPCIHGASNWKEWGAQSQQLGGTWVIQFHTFAVEQLEVCSDWCKCQKSKPNLWPLGPCAHGARQLEQRRIPAPGGVQDPRTCRPAATGTPVYTAASELVCVGLGQMARGWCQDHAEGPC